MYAIGPLMARTKRKRGLAIEKFVCFQSMRNQAINHLTTLLALSHGGFHLKIILMASQPYVGILGANSGTFGFHQRSPVLTLKRLHSTSRLVVSSQCLLGSYGEKNLVNTKCVLCRLTSYHSTHLKHPFYL